MIKSGTKSDTKKVLLKKSKKGKAGAGIWGDVSGWKEGRNISGVGDQTAYRKTIECPSLTLRTITRSNKFSLIILNIYFKQKKYIGLKRSISKKYLLKNQNNLHHLNHDL